MDQRKTLVSLGPYRLWNAFCLVRHKNFFSKRPIMSYPYQEFDPAKIRTYIRSLEQDVANLQDRLISEEGKVIALKRRFDFVLKETKSRERKQGQTQIQALRYK